MLVPETIHPATAQPPVPLKPVLLAARSAAQQQKGLRAFIYIPIQEIFNGVNYPSQMLTPSKSSFIFLLMLSVRYTALRNTHDPCDVPGFILGTQW